MIKVIKRNGEEADFDSQKIYNAVKNAYKEVYHDIEEDKLNTLVLQVVNKTLVSVMECEEPVLSIEIIQNYVEDSLMETDTDVARAYITYRYRHALARDKYKELMNDIRTKLSAEKIENQNANVDEHSFGGRMGETNDLVTKKFALDYCLSPMARNNHLNNEIYIHDLNSYAVGSHNCLTIPFDNLLAKGFNTRQTDVRPARSVSTAFQLIAVIFQLQSLQQFGGVSASHIDWTMVPYVRMSFAKHFKDGIKYCCPNASYDIDTVPDEIAFNDVEANNIKNKLAYDYAIDMTVKEVYQAVEGMYHNLKIWAY